MSVVSMQGLLPADRVGILTSGGDAPGMNAALRAAAKVGAGLGLLVLGVEEGYKGLMEGRIRELNPRALDEAARRGGTLLGNPRARRVYASGTIAIHEGLRECGDIDNGVGTIEFEDGRLAVRPLIIRLGLRDVMDPDLRPVCRQPRGKGGAVR